MNFIVKRVRRRKDLQKCFKVRYKVFIEELKFSPKEDYREEINLMRIFLVCQWKSILTFHPIKN